MTRTDIALVADSALLRQTLQTIDITVPLRTEGRKTFDAERWVICRLLSTLNQHQRLVFPLSLAHRDKPDFLVTQSSFQVGVEATEAISKQYAAFSAIAEREFPGVPREPSHFKWGSPRKTAEEMREILRQGRLTGRPWMGDRPEREWALYMESIVRDKVEKLKQVDYVKFAETWLAIYDNLALPDVDLQRAVGRLRPLIADAWSQLPTFQRIYIEHDRFMVELNQGSAKYLVIENLW